MGPSNQDEGKMTIIDILFLIVLVVIAIFLIPFYSSIFEVLKLAIQFMVGVDTYIGLLGVLLGAFMLFLGFKQRNSAIKIFGLLLVFAFIVSPFYEYLGNRKYIKNALGKYTFHSLSVIQPDGCQLEEKVKDKMSDTFQSEFGSDLDIESVPTTPVPKSDASWKEKLRCMATETHYVYNISYTDAAGEKKIIAYDGKENFNEMLKIHSYEILYQELGEHLETIPNMGKIDYQLKLYIQGRGILPLDRTSVVSEKVVLPSPNKITLKNFYQDKRILLEFHFEKAKDKNQVHQFVKELEENSEGTFPVIVSYGNTKEYYLRGSWYPYNEQEFMLRITKDD